LDLKYNNQTFHKWMTVTKAYVIKTYAWFLRKLSLLNVFVDVGCCRKHSEVNFYYMQYY